MWSILKDSLGDLTKLTVPVYFNQPLSVLQVAAIATEYMEPLEMAAKELNPIKRLAYVACYNAI